MDKSASTAMREDCTQLFLRYREIARLVWNLGFWPDPELRAIACGLAYEDAMARLFEGMVLLGLPATVNGYSRGRKDLASPSNSKSSLALPVRNYT